MLESDIKAVYARMAQLEPPPSSTVSIPAAHRRGTAMARRRRAGLIAAPALAAAAVLAITLSSIVLSSPAAPARPADSTPASAPARFSMLRPYAWFGWLPTGMPRQAVAQLAPTLEILHSINGERDISLTISAASSCQVTPHLVLCTHHSFGVGDQVIGLDGHAAYWDAPGRTLPGVPPAGNDGSLTWEYAPGGWVQVAARTLGTALRVAAGVRIGPAAGPPIRFTFQLTGGTSAWKVNAVITGWRHGVQYATSFVDGLGPGPDIGQFFSAPATGPAPSDDFAVAPGGWRTCTDPFAGAQSVEQVINGYHVLVARFTKQVRGSWLCARNADGLFVSITAFDPARSASRLFAEHVRLLGADPANWATTPIG